MTFKKAEPDKVGLVRIKVILQDPNLQPGYPQSGNLRYEVALENATVGVVQAVIENALFGGGAAEANPTADDPLQ